MIHASRINTGIVVSLGMCLNAYKWNNCLEIIYWLLTEKNNDKF